MTITKADATCCIGGRFTIDKYRCKVQHDIEEYRMGKKEKGKKGKKPCEGRSLLEMMWEELDAVFERLISDNPAADGRDEGRAEGIATCIAIVQQPYNPNLDSVREEAMARWETREAESAQ